MHVHMLSPLPISPCFIPFQLIFTAGTNKRNEYCSEIAREPTFRYTYSRLIHF